VFVVGWEVELLCGSVSFVMLVQFVDILVPTNLYGAVK
jgi:hypothetical protein